MGEGTVHVLRVQSIHCVRRHERRLAQGRHAIGAWSGANTKVSALACYRPHRLGLHWRLLA